MTWKTTTREGYRNTAVKARFSGGRPRRAECVGASKSRKVMKRHVWQDALERVDAFTKNASWQTDLWMTERAGRTLLCGGRGRYARMLGIRNMREQRSLTAAIQNIKRLVASCHCAFSSRSNR
ncbi:MAG TPA: hypothetical protein IAB20_01110 [Candidatus Pullichristensenella excrementipullorum]|nr:hypothetical protein [Candidatus Pullichristensenella excrementipullorum]